MRLLIHLILRLVGVVLLCLVCTMGWVLIDAQRSIEADIAGSADRVAARLQSLYWRELLWRDGVYREALLPAPDWDSIATLKVIAPGICVGFRLARQDPREVCSQTDAIGSAAPNWFVAAYTAVFGPHSIATRPLTIRDRDAGSIAARADPAAAIRQAWRQVVVMLGFASAMAIGIGLLAAALLGHALQPARRIVRGLRQLEQGDYRHRLPGFATAEFNHIARATNDLADRLAHTTAQRVALTKRLFQVQEDERRALARDLHDEFGQCLTATAALAAAIETDAGDRPDMRDDARAITRITKQMMSTLRGALARLRSQDLEELGLQDSLAQLVARWNCGTHGAVFHLEMAGDLATVPADAAVNVYRIAQECLTNAARHGRPRHVHLRVAHLTDAANSVALSVEDDGGGDAGQINAASGHGILGIRERISALGGSLSISGAARGVRVAASIPLPASRPTAAAA
ncbi:MULTISPECIES: histidine kinase [Rhodopseudomonas]|uniref:Histidine kinase n=1 Tax=Rhodopseudomonas palustris TaxID=1076 RepID=A0A0D7EQE2_RHOPL|nr:MULTISPECIES: histidine kinase [Rhodopseudomonas]KIZ42745.1 histidine kinase [Rhodopseudomonas palustris]MDF3813072.1 histidine kinase [Rhodopseudomonas sp. BAL398]WOK19252.1 histidine kinase [Rhodopseudomonas sp. BAL398]